MQDRTLFFSQKGKAMQTITPAWVLEHVDAWKRAKKTAPTRIQPVTPEIAEQYRDAIDPEGKPMRAEIGRYFFKGALGEQWTRSAKSMVGRTCIGGPDAEGYLLYVQTEPKPIYYADFSIPFALRNPNGKVWQSQPDGGIITWDGASDTMHVIMRDAFYATYTDVE